MRSAFACSPTVGSKGSAGRGRSEGRSASAVWPTVASRPAMWRASSARSAASSSAFSSARLSRRGTGHEVAPAEATDLALHAALFVRARDAGLAEERVEAVVRAQRDEAVALDAVAAAQHARDGRAQIVVANAPRRPAEALEGERVALEERLLALAREAHVDRPPRVREPQHEHRQLGQHAVQPDADSAEVDLRFLAPADATRGSRHSGLPFRCSIALPAYPATGRFTGHLAVTRARLAERHGMACSFAAEDFHLLSKRQLAWRSQNQLSFPGAARSVTQMHDRAQLAHVAHVVREQAAPRSHTPAARSLEGDSSRRACRGSRCGRPPGCWGSPASPSATTSGPTACLDAGTALRHSPAASAVLTKSLLRWTDRIAAHRQR